MKALLCACGAEIRPCGDEDECAPSTDCWVDARGLSGAFHAGGRHDHRPGPGSRARSIQGLLEILSRLS